MEHALSRRSRHGILVLRPHEEMPDEDFGNHESKVDITSVMNKHVRSDFWQSVEEFETLDQKLRSKVAVPQAFGHGCTKSSAAMKARPLPPPESFRAPGGSLPLRAGVRQG